MLPRRRHLQRARALCHRRWSWSPLPRSPMLHELPCPLLSASASRDSRASGRPSALQVTTGQLRATAGTRCRA